MLVIKDLRISYDRGPYPIKEILVDAIKAPPGTLIGITGETGSGKTSVLLATGGMLKLFSPSVKIEGQVELSGEKLSQGEILPGVSLVIENPYSQCSGLKATLLEEMALPLEAQNYERPQMIFACEFTSASLRVNGLLTSEIDWLSGGELQRLHLCSGLINKPRLLLIDQALTELDLNSRDRIIRLLKLYAKQNSSIVVATYSESEYSGNQFDFVINLRPRSNSSPHLTVNSFKTKDIDEDHEILVVKDLSFKYAPDGPELFRNLSFSLSKGELIFLLGPNGSGKSTLAKLLIGVLKAPYGSISAMGQPINGNISAQDGSIINCAFQNPDNYLCRGSVREELIADGPESITQMWFQEVIEILDLRRHFDVNPFDLSRGERKRLSLALAARTKPAILFLDEPSQYQDINGVELVARALRRLLDQEIAIICCTHDDRLLNWFAGTRSIILHHPDEFKEIEMAGISINMPKVDINDVQSGTQRNELSSWMKKCWDRIRPMWIESMPDVFDYWNQTVYPKLEETLGSLNLPSKISYVDIGCGHGWHTARVANLLKFRGCESERTMGIDLQNEFVNYARYFFKENPDMKFARVDAADQNDFIKICNQQLTKPPSLITSFYMLHDEPEFINVLKNTYACLSDNGIFLSVILHPNWVETLRINGLISIVADASSIIDKYRLESGYVLPWEWIGLYPMIREDGPPYFLPYFHRSLEHYEQAFRQVGFEVNKMAKLEIGRDYYAQINPIFTQQFSDRAYLPDIQKDGFYYSSLMIIARKPHKA